MTDVVVELWIRKDLPFAIQQMRPKFHKPFFKVSRQNQKDLIFGDERSRSC